MKYYSYDNGTAKEISRENARQTLARYGEKSFEEIEAKVQYVLDLFDTDDIHYWKFRVGFQR